jgi:hypothetical protein
MAELAEARAGRFTWGKVIEVNEIGPYAIVEFYPKIPDEYSGGHLVRKRGHESRPSFHAFVNGEDTSSSWRTLDEALVFAIAVRHSDWNVANHVAPAFLRGLGR